jgi:hypothetical protein
MEYTENKAPTIPNLLGFVVPLAFIPFMMGLGRQFTNAGMARMPDAVTTLAAYGRAFGLIQLVSSPFMQAQSLGLILVDSRQSFRQALKFILSLSLIPVSLILIIVFTPAGSFVIQGLHGVDDSLAVQVVFALLCLSPFPFINSLVGIQTGMLVNARWTLYISLVSLTVISSRIALVFFLMRVPFVRSRPILLPVLVAYGGIAAQLLMLGAATAGRFRTLPASGKQNLTFRSVLKFFWPLAVVTLAVGGSRPLINMLISRGPDGKEALAVLAVVFPLANLPYGWVNQNRSLVAAFREFTESRAMVRRFVWSTGFFSFTVMILLFWTPLRDIILLRWIGLSEELAQLCKWPLILFVFFPLAVMVRAYFQGIALVEHRTKAMAPSAPSRLAAILIVYSVLSATQVPGAVNGTVSLLSGFLVEALVVRYCIRRSRRKEREGQSSVISNQ